MAAKPVSNLDRIKASVGATEGKPYQLTETIVIPAVSGEFLAKLRGADVEDLNFREMLQLLIGSEATDVILAQHPAVAIAVLEEVLATTGLDQFIDRSNLQNLK
ncbi:hypothetical protein AXK57_21740 [Tsukamurella pulmonis]|uniref:hypothetical protein n=1 Tax=Tsukamurella pulmonis TaxID=47312 RepID=UPI000796D999|nr:hypothetical protein [Tsukamurella pulmonis]KXP11657.1 hypothetical protein AXK57_21740 [Tsukamurella pulmonis]